MVGAGFRRWAHGDIVRRTGIAKFPDVAPCPPIRSVCAIDAVRLDNMRSLSSLATIWLQGTHDRVATMELKGHAEVVTDGCPEMGFIVSLNESIYETRTRTSQPSIKGLCRSVSPGALRFDGRGMKIGTVSGAAEGGMACPSHTVYEQPPKLS